MLRGPSPSAAPFRSPQALSLCVSTRSLNQALVPKLPFSPQVPEAAPAGMAAPASLRVAGGPAPQGAP